MDSKIYSESLALLTDLYQLTMVHGYWKSGIADREAVFHLNFRKGPFKDSYAIAAGLGTAIDFLENFKYSDSDLEYLAPHFEPEFLDFLAKFKFSCDIDAMPEGTAVFPYEPMVRVKGPLWQAQLLESPLLNIINFQTLIATKASRICQAASPDPVIEFGMRRAQGIDGAISASRAAFIGGVGATSNVLAGKLFDIPIRGTHAHSWIMAFENEDAAFEAFAAVRPKQCTMLIDTYDSIQGVRKAIRIAKGIPNFELAGVRLDSGDLASLSIEVRNILDGEGFHSTKIMASNELDEHQIAELKKRGAKISVWGVGTRLVTGGDQSALDGVYKLSAIQDAQQKWQYKMKLSEQEAKITNPGILQVRRSSSGDVIYDELLGTDAIGRDLLVPIYQSGKLVYTSPTLHEMQAKAKSELSFLPNSVELEPKLLSKKMELHESLDPSRRSE